MGFSVPTTHNNSNYSLFHPKNLYTVTRIPLMTLRKGNDKLIVMSYET
jgi:hypothetical protein